MDACAWQAIEIGTDARKQGQNVKGIETSQNGLF